MINYYLDNFFFNVHSFKDRNIYHNYKNIKITITMIHTLVVQIITYNWINVNLLIFAERIPVKIILTWPLFDFSCPVNQDIKILIIQYMNIFDIYTNLNILVITKAIVIEIIENIIKVIITHFLLTFLSI